MSTPLPDYVPAPIADYIYRNQLAGVRGLAQKVDIPYTTLCYTFKQAEHDVIRAFLNFCNVIEADPDEVIECLRQDEPFRRESIKNLIFKKWSSCEQLYKSGLVVDTYVQRMFTGEYGKKIISVYYKLAKGTDMSFSDLAYLLAPHHAA